jgi:hypothetical protein
VRRPADLPSDAELEAAGAVIGTIEIDARDIFDESVDRERGQIRGAQACGNGADVAPVDVRL